MREREIALEILALMMRQNPALRPRAKSPRHLVSLVCAARKVIVQFNWEVARSLIDEGSAILLPQMLPEQQEAAIIGSRRWGAGDCGGHLGLMLLRRGLEPQLPKVGRSGFCYGPGALAVAWPDLFALVLAVCENKPMEEIHRLAEMAMDDAGGEADVETTPPPADWEEVEKAAGPPAEDCV